jgi:hypothetical protein
MSKKKVCKSCSGPLDDFHKDEIIKEGFCPYCVDQKGNLKSYSKILDGMLEYIENEHHDIPEDEKLSTAQKWLREGEIWNEKYVADDVVIDIVRKGELKKIKNHEHPQEGFSHSCGECMYYQSCDDGIDQKRKWLEKVQKKHGTCANVVYLKKDLVGFIQYAPISEFPKIEKEITPSITTNPNTKPSTDVAGNNWYIACIYLDQAINTQKAKKLTRLSLKYVINSLKSRDIDSVQLSAPIQSETLSSIPFDWQFYADVGFKEVDRDEQWVLGEFDIK